MSQLLLELFNKPNFSVAALSCPLAVELFAVLKSIISIAAGARWSEFANSKSDSMVSVIVICATAF